MVIVRNRYQLPSTVSSLRMFRKRVKAVLEAEERGWSHIARMIERRQIYHKGIKYAYFLTAEELRAPIFNQYASLLHKTQKSTGVLKESNSNLLKGIEDFDEAAESIQRNTMEMGRLFDELINRIKSRES